MNKDEEYVRSAWLNVHSFDHTKCCGDDGNGTWRISMEGIRGPWAKDEESAWSAAAKFTRERLEQVRQLREEIALATEMASVPESMKTLYEQKGLVFSADFLANRATACRILARLEAELTRLTAGMKLEATA